MKIRTKEQYVAKYLAKGPKVWEPIIDAMMYPPKRRQPWGERLRIPLRTIQSAFGL